MHKLHIQKQNVQKVCTLVKFEAFEEKIWLRKYTLRKKAKISELLYREVIYVV
jgi:hypothetical protein